MWAIILSLLFILVAHRVIALRRLLKGVHYHPGWRHLLSPHHPLPLTQIPGVLVGFIYQPTTVISEFGTDIITVAALFPLFMAYYVLGHTMTFKDSLHTVATSLIMRIIVPEWALSLREDWRRIPEAFAEFSNYMTEMIEDRHSGNVKETRWDLLSGLLDANEFDDLRERLANSEVLGNIFIVLVAGHETTAHTLAFALGFLALYAEEQEKLYEENYQQITSIMTDVRIPAYSEMGRFKRCLACVSSSPV